MASDRFIDFEHERPSREQVGWVIEDFLGKAAVSVTWHEDQARWYVLLPGTKSVACVRVLPETAWSQCAPELAKEERWIEVYCADEQSNVITRFSDEYTDAVADGLAKVLARYWDGKVQRG